MDVPSFSKNLQTHVRLSHDLFLTACDYYGGGYHLERNGYKMREKIHARRLKARAELSKMRANPK